MPAPISPNLSACSMTVTRQPRLANANAADSPPIPPPTITADRLLFPAVMAFSAPQPSSCNRTTSARKPVISVGRWLQTAQLNLTTVPVVQDRRVEQLDH